MFADEPPCFCNFLSATEASRMTHSADAALSCVTRGPYTHQQSYTLQVEMQARDSLFEANKQLLGKVVIEIRQVRLQILARTD